MPSVQYALNCKIRIFFSATGILITGLSAVVRQTACDGTVVGLCCHGRHDGKEENDGGFEMCG